MRRGGGGHTGFFLRAAKLFRDVVSGVGHTGFFLRLAQLYDIVRGGHTGFFLKVAQLFHDVVTTHPPHYIMETEV